MIYDAANRRLEWGGSLATCTTSGFTQPGLLADGYTVTINVTQTAWMLEDQTLLLENCGYYTVLNVLSDTQVELGLIKFDVDCPPGTIVTSTCMGPGGQACCDPLDNTPNDLDQWSGMTFWGREDVNVTNTGNFDEVDRWIDKTGANNHIDKVDNATRPYFFSSGGPNDRAWLSSVTGTKRLQSLNPLSSFVTAGAYEAYAVIRINAFVTAAVNIYDDPAVVSGAAATGYLGLHANMDVNGVTYLKAYNWDTNADVVTADAIPLAEWFKVRWRHHSGGLYIRINNNAEIGPIASGNTHSTGLSALLNIFQNAAGTYIDCDIAELMFFNRALTTTERLTLDDYHDTYFLGGCCNTFDHINLGQGPYPGLGKIRVGPFSVAGNRIVLVTKDTATDTDWPLVAINNAGGLFLGRSVATTSYLLNTTGADGHQFYAGNALKVQIETNRSRILNDLTLSEGEKLQHGTINSSGDLLDGWEVTQKKTTVPGVQTYVTVWETNGNPGSTLQANTTYTIEGLINAECLAATKSASTTFRAKFRTNGSAVPTLKGTTRFYDPEKDGTTVDWQIDIASNQVRVRFIDHGAEWKVRVVTTMTATASTP